MSFPDTGRVQTTGFEDAETVSDSFESDTEKDSDSVEVLIM